MDNEIDFFYFGKKKKMTTSNEQSKSINRNCYCMIDCKFMIFMFFIHQSIHLMNLTDNKQNQVNIDK